jgi:TRAP-type C4-dicarboxylate transport system permease small subunit
VALIFKLLALAAVIFLVWYGVRWLQRLNSTTQRLAKAQREQVAKAEAAASVATQELVACPVCGTYVAPRGAGCDRSDCPGALRRRHG